MTIKYCVRQRGGELGSRADDLRDRAITVCNQQISFSGMVYLLVGISAALTVGVGASRVANGKLSAADLLLILLLSRECFRPVLDRASGLHSAYWGLVMAEPMWDVSGGAIEIDGVDVRDLPQRSLRDLATAVP